MSSPRRSDTHYRADIDGLRAVAVLSTIAFHCFPGIFSNGYVSVDVFFVISGFLITSIILNQSMAGGFSFLNFYSRRVKRILPPALLVLATVTLIGTLTLFSNEFSSLRSYIAPAAGFYVNFRLMKDTFYFSFESTSKPLLHYWSLAIEEQFYLLWPLVFSLQYKYFSKKSGSSLDVARRIAISTFILLIPSLAYLLISQKDLYFSSYARLWELMMGCVAACFYYIIRNSDGARAAYLKYTDYLSAAGFVLLSVGLVCERKLAIVLAATGAFFLVLSSEESWGKKFLKHRLLVYLGLMSFSIYLWHWPVLSFYNMYKVVVTPIETLGLVVLIFLLSALSYHLVEKPLRAQNWDLRRAGRFSSRHLIPVGGCLLISMFFYFTSFGKPGDLLTSKLIYKEDNEFPINDSCALTDISSGETLEKWCFSQNEKKSEEGLLIGDSQAHVLYRGMVAESTKLSWHLVSAESCSPFLIPSMYGFCRRIIEDSMLNIEKHPEIRHIVMIMANHVFVEQMITLKNPEVRKQIVAQLSRLNRLNKKIYLARPTTEFPHNISGCSRQRFYFYKVFDYSGLCERPAEQWQRLSAGFNEFLDELKKEVPEIIILDGTDVVCDEKACYTNRDGTAIYQDMSHLSFEGNRRLAKKFLQTINSN